MTPDANPLPPSEADVTALRRDRILDTAEALFARGGVRGVTMEMAAEAARVAKATLYSYFRNKDALFEGVAWRLADRLTREFASALNGSGRVEDRVRSALTGKHLRVFEVVRGSPHARELFSAKDRLAREIFEAADRDMIAALAAALDADPVFAPRAPVLARALFFGAIGLADQCADPAALVSEVGGFVNIHLAGARLAAVSPAPSKEA
jgi:AcrR family transcriptional regulator